MKRKSYIFLFMVIYTAFFGQIPFNKAYHDRSEFPFPLLKEVAGDYYFFSTQFSSYVYGTCYLYKHNNEGKLIKRKLLFTNGQYRNIWACTKTLDNKLLVIGTRNPCDFMDSSAKSFITKVDTSGIPLFDLEVKTSWQTINNIYFDPFKIPLQHADSSYYIFSDSVMYHFAKNGYFISKSVNLGLRSISTAILLPNNNFLISANVGGVLNLVELNPSGNIITQSTIPVLFAKLAFYGNQGIIGLNQKFYKISPSFNILGMSAFNPGEIVRDFAIAEDTIYFISNNSGTEYYKVCDTSFNAIAQTTVAVPNFSQQAICEKDGYIGVLSACKSSSFYHGNNAFSSLSVFQWNSSANFDRDIAVTKIEADSLERSYSVSYGPGSFTTTGYFAKLKAGVWVKNVGTTTVKSTKLNCFREDNITCGALYYQRSYSGFTLQPGDSIRLVTDFIEKFNVGYTNYNPNFTLQYCIFSTLPDSCNDKNISNDGLCFNVNFNFAGLKKYAADEKEIRIFPNPAKNLVNISLPEGTEYNVKIYNVTGQLLKEEEVSADALLDVADLLPGMYFVRVYKNKVLVYSDKIIKE